MSAFLSVMAVGLFIAGVLTLVAGGLNSVFGWSLGLGIGGFDIELAPDFATNVALAVALFLLAGIFEVLAQPKKALSWIKTHKALTATLLALSAGGLIWGVMSIAGGPLGFAVEAGDTEKVQALLAEKNYSAQELNPHLYQALKKNKPDLARVLIEGGADVNHTSGEFQTPLLSSAMTWFPRESVDLLLAQNVEVNKTDSMGRTPALLLVMYRSGNFPQETEQNTVEILARLKEKGADLNLSAQDGTTVKSYAEQRKFTQVLNWLSN